eukprot:TRINITY_DN3508_c1_g1_i6.p1 TRINITY_DN3508_c1_g1~~TRINITY_DN3508_c1_g1_i6.p1  ORF type:complete len:255 (-),score=-23.45 TRINITY_DN3508_c1_g1_i6:407-1171(-)
MYVLIITAISFKYQITAKKSTPLNIFLKSCVRIVIGIISTNSNPFNKHLPFFIKMKQNLCIKLNVPQQNNNILQSFNTKKYPTQSQQQPYSILPQYTELSTESSFILSKKIILFTMYIIHAINQSLLHEKYYVNENNWDKKYKPKQKFQKHYKHQNIISQQQLQKSFQSNLHNTGTIIYQQSLLNIDQCVKAKCNYFIQPINISGIRHSSCQFLTSTIRTCICTKLKLTFSQYYNLQQYFCNLILINLHKVREL